MLHLLWHMSQWPELQKRNQIMAIIIAALLLALAVGIQVNNHKFSLAHKLAVIGITLGVLALGNGVLYVVSGVQALHTRQTQVAEKAFAARGVQATDVNTHSKTFIGTLPFSYNGMDLKCPITRSWLTTDPNDPDKYQAGDVDVIIHVHFAQNIVDVASLNCKGSIPYAVAKQQAAK
jgi:hypothetical protein